jgi:PKD repeat protein
VNDSQVTFKDTGTVHYNLSYIHWEFGDGSAVTGTKNPDHIYLKPGTYVACMTVHDSDATHYCESTKCDTVRIYKKVTCSASLTHKAGNAGSATDITLHYSRNTSFYYVDYGDGTPYVYQRPTHLDSETLIHTYKSGRYQVKLRTYDSSGTCGAIATDSIIIRVHCWDSMVHSIGCSYVYFYSWANNGPKFYYWDFGDGSTSTSPASVTHGYRKPGKYYVSLTVTDSAHTCKSIAYDSVTITAKYLHALYNYTIKSNTVSFNSDSTAGHVTYYRWDFGDGTVSNIANPVHTFTYSGDHKVCLTVWDSASCGSDYCDSFTIGNISCRTEFTDIHNSYKQATLLMDSVKKVHYRWSFGDGDTLVEDGDTALNYVKHTYKKYGYYNVCLVSADSNSCVSEFCNTIYVKPYRITGTLTRGTGAGPARYSVYLIQYNAVDSTLKAIDTLSEVGWNDTAQFAFDLLDTGYYFVKAALSTYDSLYGSYIPTYYTKEAKWKNATVIHVAGSDTAIHIDLIKGSNTSGRGFIGGKVSQGANKKGDPMGNIQVMLAGTDETPLRYTYSQNDGSFGFDNIPYGEYRVYAEIIGLIPIEATVKVDENSPREDNIEIQVDGAYVVTSIREQLQNSGIQSIMLYPNPADNRLNLDIRSVKNSHATINLYSVTGQSLLQTQADLHEGQQTIQLQLDKLPAGMYMIKMTTANGLWEQSFIKRN